MADLEPAAVPVREPECERHGCKHPLSDHATAEENQVRPCRACACPAFSGWAGQRGRAGATA